MSKNTKYTYADIFNGRAIGERYTRIPHTLIDHAGDLGLDAQELAFVVVVLRRKYGRQTPFPSYAEIGRALGFKVQQRVRKDGTVEEECKSVQRLVAGLVKKGLLTIRRRTASGIKGSNELDLDPLFAKMEAFEAGQVEAGQVAPQPAPVPQLPAAPIASTTVAPRSNVRALFGGAKIDNEPEGTTVPSTAAHVRTVTREEVEAMLKGLGIDDRCDCQQYGLSEAQFALLIHGGPEAEVLAVLEVVRPRSPSPRAYRASARSRCVTKSMSSTLPMSGI